MNLSFAAERILFHIARIADAVEKLAESGGHDDE